MKPQMGWEVARAAAWQEYGAEGWSHLEAKQGQETKGWAVGAASNPHPLTLALALPSCVFGDTHSPHAASCALLGHGIVGISAETLLGGRSDLRYWDC